MLLLFPCHLSQVNYAFNPKYFPTFLNSSSFNINGPFYGKVQQKVWNLFSIKLVLIVEFKSNPFVTQIKYPRGNRGIVIVERIAGGPTQWTVSFQLPA
jgi:hypothetical protein